MTDMAFMKTWHSCTVLSTDICNKPQTVIILFICILRPFTINRTYDNNIIEIRPYKVSRFRNSHFQRMRSVWIESRKQTWSVINMK